MGEIRTLPRPARAGVLADADHVHPIGRRLGLGSVARRAALRPRPSCRRRQIRPRSPPRRGQPPGYTGRGRGQGLGPRSVRLDPPPLPARTGTGAPVHVGAARRGAAAGPPVDPHALHAALRGSRTGQGVLPFLPDSGLLEPTAGRADDPAQSFPTDSGPTRIRAYQRHCRRNRQDLLSGAGWWGCVHTRRWRMCLKKRRGVSPLRRTRRCLDCTGRSGCPSRLCRPFLNIPYNSVPRALI